MGLATTTLMYWPKSAELAKIMQTGFHYTVQGHLSASATDSLAILCALQMYFRLD